MSFSYEDFYLSGFNTGVTISGIQKQTPLFWIVTGLKYDGTPVTTADFSWFTGIVIADSGTLTPQSGFMGYDAENDDYRGILTFDVASGLTATGCIELYWNSGSAVQEGYTLEKQFETFSNKNKDAWNILTIEDGSVDNADLLHSHAGAATQLQDLSDVARTGAFVYTSGYVLKANGYDSYECSSLPDSIDATGYETVSGDYILHVVDSTAHHDPTGYESVSGDYKNHILDSTAHINPTGYETVSGSWIAASGDLDDYKAVSGDFSEVSGDYAITSGTVDDYKVVSGDVASSLKNIVEDITPQLGADLDCQDYDLEKVGTVYHNDSITQWLVRISSDGTDTGTLYDIGLQWIDASNILEVVGYNSLNLGIFTDHDIIDITNAGVRFGATNARVTEFDTGTLIDSDTLIPTSKAVGTSISGDISTHAALITAHHDPSGYESVSGDFLTHITSVIAHHDPSGYETISGDYLITSGTVDDYVYVSGRYALTSGSYNTHLTTSTAHHNPSGYETVSGSYITHIANTTAHHDPSGYETISGDYLTHAASSTAHINPTGYETVSGSWIIASGDLDDYKVVSGDYVTSSGSWETAKHTRLHSITDVLDHSAGNNKIFYSDGSAHVQELALGTSGYILFSNGDAPVFGDIANAGFVENPMNLELDGDGYNIVDLGDLTLRINKSIAVSGTATIAGITHDNLVDKSASESITAEWTYSVFPISPSAAPDANYEFANKKYVDDQVAGGGYSDDDARDAIAYYVTTEAAFADAITAIGAGYGIIRFYAGTITLTSSLLVNGGGSYIIEGFGDKTVIDVGGNWKAFNVTSAASCVLRNFKIDAADLTETITHIIEIIEASNNKVIVDNVKIVGDGTNGYGIWYSSNNVVVYNCWIQDVYNGIISSGGDQSKIIKNTCYSNNYHGIYLDGGDHCVVLGNHSFSNTRDGIYLSDSASNNVISSNYCYLNYVGIHLYSNANNNIINGNISYDNIEEGIYINGCDNNSFSANTCNANGTNGIWLNDSNNNTIGANTCNDNDIDDGNNFGGIYLTTDSNNNNIVGNTCNNNNNIGAGFGHGIHIATDTCNNNTVGGNTLLGNDTQYTDSGTDTILLGDDTAYNATSWDTDLGTPTKNAVRDKFVANDALIDANIANMVEDITPQLGGDLDLNQKGIILDPTPTSNDTWNGIAITGTVDDASTVYGNLLYKAVDGHWERADANAVATLPCHGMALEAGAGSKGILLYGVIRHDDWDWILAGGTGDLLYVSETPGDPTQTMPSGSAVNVQIIGFALSDDEIMFKPDNAYGTWEA